MADYNINAITRRVVFTGSAGVGPYAFSFEVLDQNDVAVYFNTTSLTLTTDYTVTVNANGTGSVTLVTGSGVPTTPTASDTVIIIGARDIERVTDFVTAGDLLASSLNEQLDALTIINQQLAEEGQRSMRAPVYDPALVADGGTLNMTLPPKADRVDTVMAFDTNGNPVKGPTVAGVATMVSLAADIATLADIEDGTVATDAISDTAAIAANVTTVAGIAPNVTTVAGNTANVNTVAGNTSNINTVAGNNANVTTVAGISGNVTTVAGISADVTAVAGDTTDIGTVSTNIANVNTVAGISADVTTVAGMSSADITTVAGISSDVTTAAGISANITTVAGISADVTAAATNASDISAIAAEVAKVVTVANDLNEVTSEIDTVANSIANVDLVGGSIANVNTVATNLTDINSFANTYFISATAPVSPTTGDLWFDTANSVLKNYNGIAWVAASSSVNGTAQRVNYTATAGQTTFAATYDVGFVDVYLNGVKLIETTDFTATNGTSIVLISPAAVNDTVDIIGYGIFQLANFSINDANDVNTSGATTGQFLKYDGANWVADNVPAGGIASVVDDTTPQLGGTLDVNSNNIDFGQNNKALFGGVGGDLEIYHSGTNAFIDNNDGILYIRNNVDGDDGSDIYIQAKPNEQGIIIQDDGEVRLYYDNAEKLNTSSTGVTIAGDVSVTNGDLSEVLISQVIPSGSPTVIDFDNLPTAYDTYRFDFNLDVAATNNEIYVQVINSSGGIESSTNAYFYDKLTNGTRSFVSAGTTAIQICSSTSGANDNRGIRGSMYVYGRNMNFGSSADTMPMFTWSLVNLNNTGVHETVTGGASINPAGALNLGSGMRGVRFYSSTNFNNQGFISVYGIRSTPV